MLNPKVAQRYAKSLINLATERNEVDAVEKDMNLILEVLEESKDMRLLLQSPVVNTDKKEKILDAVFGGHITEMSKGFIRILTSKGRESLLLEVSARFVELVKQSKGILTAKVITAGKLTDEDRASINKMVAEMNQGTAEIEEVVDPSIVGGFILKVEDKMVDASVTTQLRKLRRNFTDKTYESTL